MAHGGTGFGGGWVVWFTVIGWFWMWVVVVVGCRFLVVVVDFW